MQGDAAGADSASAGGALPDHPDDRCLCNRRRAAHDGADHPFKLAICFDCPDLDNDAERPADPSWRPRPRCCRDEHIDRRLAGDERPWEGIDRSREISAKEEAAGIKPQPQEPTTRQQRRARTRKARR